MLFLEMRSVLAIAAAIFLVFASNVAAKPVGSCPPVAITGDYYIADEDDLCVYYQCVFGSPLLRQCAKGTRVPSYYQVATSNPCTLRVSESVCLRCNISDTAPPADVVGTYCQEKPGLCGTCGCVNQVAGYWCNCSVTPSALPLESLSPVPLCAVNVCQNGGTCHKLYDDKPLCLCAPGYTGDLCEHKLCDYNPCMNGGQCVSNNTLIHCNCTRCYTGSCCENPITTDPTCNTGPTGPTCDQCHTGPSCSQALTWLCSCNPCPTGQLCSDTTPGTVRRCSTATGTSGDQFTLMFEQNWADTDAGLEIYVTPGADDGQPRNVYAYAKYGADLDCPFDATETILPGQVYKFDVPPCLRHDGTGQDRKGIRVVELNGLSITVYGVDRATFSADSWLALPDRTASKNFVALSWAGFQSFQSQCGIVAIYNDTQISIYPSVDTDEPSSAGSVVSVTLDEFGTYQVQAVPLADISGTVIVTSQPVHVTCGHVRAYVQPDPSGPLNRFTGSPSRDFLVEEMVGTEYWATTFAVVPITRQIIGYSYTEVAVRIAGYTTTQCTFYSSDPAVPPSTVALAPPYFLYRGYYDAAPNYFVNCSNPVLVVELSESALPGISLLDDPALMYVPGVSQYTNFYKFAPPIYSVNALPYQYIYAKLAARDVDYAAVTINGVAPTSLKPWTKISVPPSADAANYPSLYGGVFELLGNGSSTILAPSSTVKFMCIVYAFDNRESIGHVAGSSLSVTNTGLSFDVVNRVG